MQTSSLQNNKKIAVIDIGSNSVRMVVYEEASRFLVPIFNEKVLCELGRGLSESGMLCPSGRIKAKEAIATYVKILRSIGIDNVYVFATAAVRDARDGMEFAKEITKGGGGFIGLKSALGVGVTILSGEEEATYGALGVISSIHDVHGVVGDLGGGSLELVSVEHDRPLSKISLPIGHFRVMDATHGKPKNASKFLNKILKHEQSLGELKGKTFYAVGGGFRAIAKVHITMCAHPIRVIHNYAIASQELFPLLEALISSSKADASKFAGLSDDRSETIQYSAAILRKVIEMGEPSEVVFSAYGVREGFVYSMLTDKIRMQDSLIASSAHLSKLSGVDSSYSFALLRWLKASMGKLSGWQERIVEAASALSEISWCEHPDYRAEFAFQRAIEFPLIGIDHKGRAMLAVSLYHRYKTKPKKYFQEIVGAILNGEEIRFAVTLGLLMGVAGKYSRADAHALEGIGIKIEADKVVVSEYNAGALILLRGDGEKKLQKFANYIGLAVSGMEKNDLF